MKLPPKSRSKLGLLKRNVEMLGCRYEVPAADDPDNVIVAVYLREKKSSLTYSPSNLFGQPLLVGVPKADTNYEQLYEIVLKSLSRFVTVPDPSEEWWKKPNAAEMQNGIADNAVPTAQGGSPIDLKET